jgi:ATP-dependent DNA helicase DinG
VEITPECFLESNLSNGKTILLERRRNPITQAGVERLLIKLRNSKIAGLGRLEAESETPLTLSRLQEITSKIFREILPEYGYNIRSGQIKLAEKMLESVAKREILLAEAAVGIGKTLVYIIIGALIKRSRINQMWSSGFFPDMSVSEWEKMPVLISTSSIALQKAILTEYIPEISRILVENGVIKTPLRAVLRKGKEHYIFKAFS